MNRLSYTKICSLLLIIIMIFAGCSSAEVKEEIELLEPSKAKLETSVAERINLSETVAYEGYVFPDFEELTFGREGYIYDIFVSPGETVEQGDVLAAMTGPNYAEIETLKDEIKDIEDSREDTYKYLDAQLELAKAGGRNTSELSLTIKHQKEIFELELQQKKDRLEELEADDIGYVYIEAPYTSTVISTAHMSRGSYVGKDTKILALEAYGAPKISCEFINEKTYNSLYDCYVLIHGKRYEIEYEPYSKELLKDFAANNVVPDAIFTITSEDISDIDVGDYAMVITVADFRENVLTVPSNAIFSDSTGKFVYEVIDNVRTKKQVVTGISDSAYVEIVSGIEEGASVYVKN